MKRYSDLQRTGNADVYKRQGWYSDGPNGQKDYYISFAIHFYSLVYAMTMEDDDPERCAKYRSRAEIFAHDFIYWFADDGEALPYGRSLTYRFAQLAFWSACVVSGVLPFEEGIIKGIIERGLGKWLDNPDIFDNGGILTIGYKYPSLHMACLLYTSIEILIKNFQVAVHTPIVITHILHSFSNLPVRLSI